MPLLLPGVWPPGRREPCVLQGGSPPRSVCLFEDLVSSSPAIRQSCSDSYHLGEGEGAGGRGALPKSRLRPARPRGSRARHLPRTPPIPMFPLRSEGRELPFTELLATASARWLD